MSQTDPAVNCTEPEFSEESNKSGFSAVSDATDVADAAQATATPASRSAASRPQLIYETGAGLFGFFGVMLGIETGYRFVSAQPSFVHLVLLIACWVLVVVLWRSSRKYRIDAHGQQ
ncbi:MAG: hypothetical protein Q4D85_02590 [Corynebacterium sp.]|uniref:hypothetical protein n=1 Tax=Corynebacterium sp. TaxID=1720 RepID=UPI0026DC39D1|nr:hypothetical protein [Corynebacterium sp.]MDO5097617.1 hypothetical protein [Corynebacterium sp.]